MKDLHAHTQDLPGRLADEVGAACAERPSYQAPCWLYLSHEEKDGTWEISRLRPEGGDVEAVLRGLPCRRDHWVNYLAFDREEALYFGVGSSTNSSVVAAADPVNGNWIKKPPDMHGIPCRDVPLVGKTFSDDDTAGPISRPTSCPSPASVTVRLPLSCRTGGPSCVPSSTSRGAAWRRPTVCCSSRSPNLTPHSAA